jgi:hypothetical protein
MVIEWRRELRDAVSEMLAVATLKEIAEAVEAASDQKDCRLIGAEAQRDRARASANKSSESR